MSLLQPVTRARRRSLWLQEALAREPEAEIVDPLSGGHRTDVVSSAAATPGYGLRCRLSGSIPRWT